MPKTIAQYIAATPKEARRNLREMHAILRKAAPGAKDAIKEYRTGKGSIQFPHDQPLPKTLIRRMAALRVKELREKDARWM